MLPALKRKITRIVVHTSDSPDNRDIGAKEIRDWHTLPPPHGNGWSDIGYHFVVRRDGTIEIGRPLEIAGSHVSGHNKDTIGVVWVGRDRPTVIQRESLLALLKQLCDEYKVPVEKVLGHKELNPGKTCPNLDCDVLRKDLANV